MGRIIFWIGTAGVIISLLMLLLGLLGGFIHSDYLSVLFFWGLPILFFSLPPAALGLIILLFRLNEKGKQVFGCMLFLVGLVGFIISYFLGEAGVHSTEDIPQFVLPLFSMLVGGISLIFSVAGIILVFKGRNQGKKQKYQVFLYNSDEHHPDTFGTKEAIAGLLVGIVLIIFAVYIIVNSQEPTYHNPCGEGYFPAANNHSICCQNGLPYYWSSDGICHSALPPTPTGTPPPTPTPTPSPCTLTVIYSSDGGFTIPNEGSYQYQCGTSINLYVVLNPGLEMHLVTYLP
jgi:hypothetical protein